MGGIYPKRLLGDEMERRRRQTDIDGKVSRGAAAEAEMGRTQYDPHMRVGLDEIASLTPCEVDGDAALTRQLQRARRSGKGLLVDTVERNNPVLEKLRARMAGGFNGA